MARIARVIAPGLPHHITQRGNRHPKHLFFNLRITTLKGLGVISLALMLLLYGCPAMKTRPLTQPERESVRGTYVHPPSKFTFPESIGDFQRVAILRYDADGLDVSVGYNLVVASRPIAATVYIYPAPSLISIGSPPNVIAAAKARLTENEFEYRKQEIQHRHPGALLIEQRDTVRTEGGKSYPGKGVIFEYEDLFAGSRIPLLSRLYLFSYIGDKWTVKYRFTYPKGSDAEKDIQQFIQELKWYEEAL